MEYRQGLLGFSLGRNETHRRTRSGFANRLSVDKVVFVPLDEGLNELRGNQLGCVSHCCQLTSNIVRPRTGLHCHDTARQAGEKLHHLRP